MTVVRAADLAVQACPRGRCMLASRSSLLAEFWRGCWTQTQPLHSLNGHTPEALVSPSIFNHEALLP